jgi:hypothetical protein
MKRYLVTILLICGIQAAYSQSIGAEKDGSDSLHALIL